MKRTYFKSRKDVNWPVRKKLNKKSPRKISAIQRKIWEYCKVLIRAKYGHECYTCGAKGLTGANCQTGHCWPKETLGAYLKYDLRVLRVQCYHCNINCGGRGADFVEKMRRVEGNEYVDQIIKDKQITVNAMDHYLKIEQEYKAMVNDIDLDIKYI